MKRIHVALLSCVLVIVFMVGIIVGQVVDSRKVETATSDTSVKPWNESMNPTRLEWFVMELNIWTSAEAYHQAPEIYHFFLKRDSAEKGLVYCLLLHTPTMHESYLGILEVELLNIFRDLTEEHSWARGLKLQIEKDELKAHELKGAGR
ncbi:hypothetical protein ACFL1X_03835 [Candidatus Hydrogenedentota bacterium]